MIVTAGRERERRQISIILSGSGRDALAAITWSTLSRLLRTEVKIFVKKPPLLPFRLPRAIAYTVGIH